MLSFGSGIKVWISSNPVDMRKGSYSLAAMVQQEFKLEPKSSNLFVFFGRNKNRVKILQWDRNGFMLFYKILATGRFRPPKVGGKRYEISMSDLNLLMEGIDLTYGQRLLAI